MGIQEFDWHRYTLEGRAKVLAYIEAKRKAQQEAARHR